MPPSNQACSSSPMSLRVGSLDSVVLPVPGVTMPAHEGKIKDKAIASCQWLAHLHQLTQTQQENEQPAPEAAAKDAAAPLSHSRNQKRARKRTRQPEKQHRVGSVWRRRRRAVHGEASLQRQQRILDREQSPAYKTPCRYPHEHRNKRHATSVPRASATSLPRTTRRRRARRTTKPRARHRSHTTPTSAAPNVLLDFPRVERAANHA